MEAWVCTRTSNTPNSLRHTVLCAMCVKGDAGGLAQQWVLLLLLWCCKSWNSLHACHRSHTKLCARETGDSRTCMWRILKTIKHNSFIPRLFHALNEDDPDWRVQYCEWFQNMVRGGWGVCWEKCLVWWSTDSQHNCVHLAPENPHVHVENEVICRVSASSVDFKGTNWSILFRRHRYWSNVPRHVTDINLTCNSYTFWEW